MAEEIDVENGRNSNFEGLVTLTFDPAIRHVVLHQSSTSTYIPNFIQIEETFCGRTDVRTYGRMYGRTDISPLYIIRSTLGSRPNKYNIIKCCHFKVAALCDGDVLLFRLFVRLSPTRTDRALACLAQWRNGAGVRTTGVPGVFSPCKTSSPPRQICESAGGLLIAPIHASHVYANVTHRCLA